MLRALSFLLLLSAGAPAQEAEVRTFDVSRKTQNLRVRHNEGLLRVRAWDQRDQVEIRFKRRLPEGVEPDQVKVFAWKSGSSIYLHSYLYAHRGEGADIEVRMPRGMNLYVKGIGPRVEVFGLNGYARVDTLRAQVTLEEVSGRFRVTNREGDTLLRLTDGLRRSSYLRSVSGNIRCQLGEGLDLSVPASAGRRLLWNGQNLLQEAHKLLGTGRPRLALQSDEGSIAVESKTPARQAEAEAEGRVPRNSVAESAEPAQGKAQSASEEAPDSVSAPSPAVSEANFKVDVDWVHLNVSVQNRRSGEYVTDLGQDDFQVWEEGQLQQIARFTSTEAPFHLLLLLDVSGSTEDYFGLLKKAALAFTEHLNQEDRIALMAFNTRAKLIQGFTNDRLTLERAIRSLDSGGGTSFYYSLHDALTRHLSQVAGRKAVVVFTDGVDDTLQGQYNTSRGITFHEAHIAAQESDSLVYTIFLDTEDYYRETQRGRRAFNVLPERVFQEARAQLERIAQQTGGQIYTPKGIDDLLPAFVEIARQMRFQYTLGYIRGEGGEPGQWRSLRVTLKDRSDLFARHRQGFRITGRPD